MTIVNEVNKTSIEEIARECFGTGTRVESTVEIRPILEHDIWKHGGCNANLSYVVSLVDQVQKYVFRFSRGYRADRFDHERQMYELIQMRTGIPTPRIHRIDRTYSIVPTSYVVMDYMEGEEFRFLCDPRNPITSATEKREIEQTVGRCYAALHSVTRPAEPDEVVREVLGRLDQLRSVVRAGEYAIPPEKVERCGEVISRDPCLRNAENSLCIGDADLHLSSDEGTWRPAFICDTEWTGFKDPYCELADFVCWPQRLWELTSPLTLKDSEETLKRPFFQGYAETRKIDVDRLRSACVYAHFGLLCSILDDLFRPHKRDGAKAREAICAQVVDAIIDKSRTSPSR